MNTDGWRLHYTYAIAALCLIGGGVLVFLKLGEIPAEALLALITFVFGLVLGFVFNRESSAGQARATERAVAQGANAGATPDKAE